MRGQRRGALTRRRVLAAMPGRIERGATTTRAVFAQPSAADPVIFALGQVLALATLQSEAIGRLRSLLAAPNAEDAAWQAGAAEAIEDPGDGAKAEERPANEQGRNRQYRGDGPAVE